jgi:hypothetical protein
VAVGPAAQRVADSFTVRSLNLLRYDAQLRADALKVLKKLEAELAAQIAAVDPTGTRTAYQQARLKALLQQTGRTIQTAYQDLCATSQRDLFDFAGAEVDWVRLGTARVVGVDLLHAGVSEAQLKSIVSNTLIEGAPSKEWWSRQAPALMRRFSDQMRMGVLRGESIDELVRRVRGTKAKNFQDGIMNASRREAQALVRTSVNAIANNARVATYQANDDVIRGIQHLSTLDGRTTEICIAMSGACWNLDGDPLPESPVQEPYRPLPYHWGERSTHIPILRPLGQLLRVGGRRARALDAMPKSTQASMDGQVAEDLNYESWLRTKPEIFQKEVLGPGRWDLWQRNQIGLHQLIDQSGRPLRLEELRAL